MTTETHTAARRQLKSRSSSSRNEKIKPLIAKLITMNEFVSDSSKYRDRLFAWLRTEKKHAKNLKAFDDAFRLALRDDDDLALTWNQMIIIQDEDQLRKIFKSNRQLQSAVEKHLDHLLDASQAWDEFKHRQLLGATDFHIRDTSSAKLDHDYEYATKIVALTYELRQRYHDNLARLLALRRKHPGIFETFAKLAESNPRVNAQGEVEWQKSQFLAPNPKSKYASQNVDMRQRFNVHVAMIENICQHILSSESPDRSSDIDQMIMADYFQPMALSLRQLVKQNRDFATAQIQKMLAAVPYQLLSYAYNQYKVPPSTQPLTLSQRTQQDVQAMVNFIYKHRKCDEADFIDQFDARFAFHPLLVVLDMYHRSEDLIHVYHVSRRFHDHARFLDSQFPILEHALNCEATAKGRNSSLFKKQGQQSGDNDDTAVIEQQLDKKQKRASQAA